jgi:adenosylcobinamide-phosphate synthase
MGAPAVLLGALVIDLAFGEPRIIYKYISHPVTWMGRFLSFLEGRGNQDNFRSVTRKILGLICLVVYLSVVTLPAFLLDVIAPDFLVIILASVFLSARSLVDHVLDVTRRNARLAVAKIVGRRVEDLDHHGVNRAAIESLAENFSDGVIAPCFWFLVAGFPGIVCYKAINTADSMIGYKTKRYRDFGWAAARLDDVANYIPARLTAILIAAGSLFHPKGRSWDALYMALKYACRHKSPNAGWPEAAMAGALSLRLGGPRCYGDLAVEGTWLGEGREKAEKADILDGVQIVLLCIVIILILLGGLFYETWR